MTERKHTCTVQLERREAIAHTLTGIEDYNLGSSPDSVTVYGAADSKEAAIARGTAVKRRLTAGGYTAGGHVRNDAYAWRFYVRVEFVGAE